jgi:hypothetical protein
LKKRAVGRRVIAPKAKASEPLSRFAQVAVLRNSDDCGGRYDIPLAGLSQICDKFADFGA